MKNGEMVRLEFDLEETNKCNASARTTRFMTKGQLS